MPSEEGPLCDFIPKRNISLIDSGTIPNLTQFRKYVTSHKLHRLVNLNTKYKDEVMWEFYQKISRSR